MDAIRSIAAGLVLAALLATSSGGAEPPAVPQPPAGEHDSRVAFPDTEPGRRARDWFVAFNAGEQAMREYLVRNVAAEDLARRSIEQRLEVWREMHGEMGRATPQRVVASGPDFVELRVHGDNGARRNIRFQCRAEPPHMLQGLRVEDVEDEPSPGGPASPEAAGPPPDDATIVAGLAAELDSLTRSGAFSGTVLLDKNGRTLFQRAAGMRSREARRPNAIDTRFNLGSINKIFTHVAILQLEQQGKLRLDDTLERYLDDAPVENARRITIRMLLEHRGGVADVLDRPELREQPERVRTVSDWYRLIRDVPLEFDPGTRQKYSNGGFVMLGAIVERVSRQDYYAYVREHVYVPAAMASTEHDSLGHRDDRTATSYTRRADSLVARPKSYGRGSPAGGGYSTAPDLVRFARALRDGRLLDAAHRVQLVGEGTRLGIAGGSPGVNALLVIQGPYTLVVLANQDPPAAERFSATTGRQLARATGAPAPGKRVGGGS